MPYSVWSKLVIFGDFLLLWTVFGGKLPGCGVGGNWSSGLEDKWGQTQQADNLGFNAPLLWLYPITGHKMYCLTMKGTNSLRKPLFMDRSHFRVNRLIGLT